MFYIILYKHCLFDKILIYIHEICKIHDIPFTLCIYGECCKDTIPCKKGAFYQVFKEYTQYQRNQEEEIGDRYLVFYQKNILQKYEYDFMNRNHQEDSISMTQFLLFMKEQQKYYQQFSEQWMIKSSPNKIIIDYHDFQTQPLKYTMDFLQFLYPHFLFDQSKIYQMIRNFEKEFTSISYFHFIQNEILQKNKYVTNSSNQNMTDSSTIQMDIDSDNENKSIEMNTEVNMSETNTDMEVDDIIELVEEIKEMKISPQNKHKNQNKHKPGHLQHRRKIPMKIKQRQIQKLQKELYIARYKKDKKLSQTLQKLIHMVRKS
jgi:hypothetical protein